jgi:hypothetical protein
MTTILQRRILAGSEVSCLLKNKMTKANRHSLPNHKASKPASEMGRAAFSEIVGFLFLAVALYFFTIAFFIE